MFKEQALLAVISAAGWEMWWPSGRSVSGIVEEELHEMLLERVEGVEVAPAARLVDVRKLETRKADEWSMRAPLIGMAIGPGLVLRGDDLVPFASELPVWGNVRPLDRVGPELYVGLAQLLGARVVRIGTWRQMYRYKIVELIDRTAAAIREFPLFDNRVHNAIEAGAQAMIEAGKGKALFLSIDVDDQLITSWLVGKSVVMLSAEGKPHVASEGLPE